MEQASDTMFGIRAKTARERRGMSQTDLARATGMDQAWISNIEAGRRDPNLQNLFRLCLALRVSADELLGLPTVTEQAALERYERARQHVAALTKIYS